MDIFWSNHDPTTRSWSRQYRAAIFYHNDYQKKLALETSAHLQATLTGKIMTDIIPFIEFSLAEEYHQKLVEKIAETERVVEVQGAAVMVGTGELVAEIVGVEFAGNQRTLAHFRSDGRGTEFGAGRNHRADGDSWQVVEQQQAAFEVRLAQHACGRQCRTQRSGSFPVWGALSAAIFLRESSPPVFTRAKALLL